MSSPAPSPKRIIHEISGWLRIFEDGSIERTYTGPQQFLQLTSPVPPHSSPINNLSLLDFPPLPSQPTLRLYLPTNSPPHLPNPPILLHFHGGGFCISHFSWLLYHHFYSRLALSLPAIIASVNLPLAPEHPLPSAFHAAFQSLLTLPHIPNLNPHLTRVFLIGDSSGANIVHEVCAMAARAEPPIKLAGGIAIHPGFVRVDRSASERNSEWESPLLTIDMLDKFLALALPEGADKNHHYVCPMEGIEERLGGVEMAPIMVVVAERDLVRDRELEYCEAMKKIGKDVEVFFQSGVGHSFYLNKFAVDEDEVTGRRTEELILGIKDFVDRH